MYLRAALLVLLASFLLTGCVGRGGGAGKQATTVPKPEVEMEELAVGSGPKPKKGDTVWLHYKGQLKNGTVFENTYETGKPLEYTLGEDDAMRGWEQAIPEMQVEGKYKVIIPPHLGYGSRKKGKIPPNSTLIYEMEIGKIESGKEGGKQRRGLGGPGGGMGGPGGAGGRGGGYPR